jgi:mRNA interferase MazF
MLEELKIIQQFSIWLVQLEEKPIGHEQGGDRPFLVISNNIYNHNSKTPIGFILSTSEKKGKNKFALQLENMPSNLSHVNISQIRTLDYSRFTKKISEISEKEGKEIIQTFLRRMT